MRSYPMLSHPMMVLFISLREIIIIWSKKKIEKIIMIFILTFLFRLRSMDFCLQCVWCVSNSIPCNRTILLARSRHEFVINGSETAMARTTIKIISMPSLFEEMKWLRFDVLGDIKVPNRMAKFIHIVKSMAKMANPLNEHYKLKKHCMIERQFESRAARAHARDNQKCGFAHSNIKLTLQFVLPFTTTNCAFGWAA